ncbi:MAG: hypothetical protein P8100_06760 [bacterium]|jgi:hypothetical protein
MDKLTPKKNAICRYLRAKNSFGMMEGGEDPWYGIEDPNATFWCVRTSGPTGPDNNVCSMHSCLPGRKCYKSPDHADNF